MNILGQNYLMRQANPSIFECVSPSILDILTGYLIAVRIQVDCAWGPGSQKLLPDFFHPPGHILEGLFLEILDCQPEPETEAQGQFVPGAPSVAALLDVVPELTSHGTHSVCPSCLSSHVPGHEGCRDC